MNFVASFLRPQHAVGLAANCKSGLQFDLKHQVKTNFGLSDS